MKFHFFFRFLLFFSIFSTHVLFSTPFVTSVSPYAGPSSGGINVTISGSGFSGATMVNFGRTPAAVFNIVDDTTIIALSPAHSPQVVSITVTASGTSPSTPDSYFVYQDNNWHAFVANFLSGNVSVVDTIGNAVIATPTVGKGPISIAVTPDGTKTFVVNSDDKHVSVIDTANNSVVATLNVGDQPRDIAITPNGIKAFVTNNTFGNVSVIDVAGNSVIATTVVGSNPGAIAITPDGTKAFVANLFDASVSVIDVASNSVIATAGVGNTPVLITITPDGTKAFVANFGNDKVSVIDVASNAVIATIDVGIGPFGIAITPDGTKAFVANGGFNTVSVIDVASNAVSATTIVGNNPGAIAITPNGATAFVANGSDNTVSAINVASNAVIATIGVGNIPQAIVITPDGTKAFVVNKVSNSISVIDAATRSVIATLDVGNSPFVIAMTPDQAPLAKFTAFIAPAGSLSSFDGSGSVSPIGSIINYAWDFGDGNVFSDSQPLASHIYAIPGNYLVTLKVTNSAGTSTHQIFNPSSNSNSVSTNNTFLTHNGGSTALARQLIAVLPPFPPADLKGRQIKNTFAAQTDIVNILTWKAPSGGAPPVSYRIYRDKNLTKLAAVIAADEKLRFEDHNRKKDRKYRYFVISVDVVGNLSAPSIIVISPNRVSKGSIVILN